MRLAERGDAIANLLAGARELADAEPARILRNDLNELGFAEFGEDVAAIQHEARQIITAQYDDVPAFLIQEANTGLAIARQAFGRMVNFAPMDIAKQSRNPAPEREAIANEARQQLPQTYVRLAQLFAFLGARAGERGVARIDEVSSELTGRLRVAAEASEKRAAELEHLLNARRDAVQKAVVGEQASHFSRQADEHRRAGRWWLGATALGALIIIGMAGRSYGVVSDPSKLPTLTSTQVTQLVAAKVLLYSVLLTATVWCGRIYRAHRHNYVVNRHRQNALATFDAFVASANDETRNTVLVQASTAIFAPQHTGFATTEADPAMPAVTEVLKVLPSKP